MIGLRDYILKRNGLPMGHSKSLSNNLERALGAKNFSRFWVYWNPIFSYYLGRYTFKPLHKIINKQFSLVITFFLCGLLHDAVTKMVRGETYFFFLFSLFVLRFQRSLLID